jgi:hypothetical protein
MYVVFDLEHAGEAASTGPASRGGDLLVVPVNVFSPGFVPLPLTPFFNADGASGDLNRADGDLDGQGRSLPAELLPPYVTRPATGSGGAASPLYPCGLWTRALGAPGGDRVTFLYPSKADRALNLVACDGQRLALPVASRRAVHLLALAEGAVTAEFRLIYADGGAEARPLTMSPYTARPTGENHAAFALPHRHTRAGDDIATPAYLTHYALPASATRLLAAVELPRNRAIKVMAVTLEGAG